MTEGQSSGSQEQSGSEGSSTGGEGQSSGQSQTSSSSASGEGQSGGQSQGSGEQSQGQSPDGVRESQVQAQAGSDLEPKVANLLAYIFGALGGLIVYLTQRNREVRFHAAQSIMITIAFVAVAIVLNILAGIFGAIGIGVLAVLIGFLGSAVLWLAGLALVIVMCIKGYNEEHYKLPVIGDLAETWAGK